MVSGARLVARLGGRRVARGGRCAVGMWSRPGRAALPSAFVVGFLLGWEVRFFELLNGVGGWWEWRISWW